MGWFHVPTMVERAPRPGERRVDTGGWITPPGGVWSADDLAACGFAEIVATERPADTDTHTSDRSVRIEAGQPVETWTVRPWTEAELAALAAPLAGRAELVAQIEQATTVTKLRAAILAAVDGGLL